MSDKKELYFSLKGFQILNFSFYTPESQIRKDRINFGVQHRFRKGDDNGLFHVDIKVKVAPGKKAGKNIAFIETQTSYLIKGLKEKGLNTIPKDLLITLFSIAYSNTRGALAAKGQGTILGDIPLPLIDPVKVIESIKKRADADSEGTEDVALRTK